MLKMNMMRAIDELKKRKGVNSLERRKGDRHE
jgi:hypothetical protein